MSPTSPAELTRRSFAAAGSGDFDLMLSFYARDAVFDMSAWGLGVHTGSKAIRRFFESWIGAFAEFSMDVAEVVELDRHVVFAVADQQARTAGSRGWLRIRHAAISVWQDEAIVRVTNYKDIDQARADASAIAEAAEAGT